MGSVDDRCMQCGGPRRGDELGYICDRCSRRLGLAECECPHTRAWYCGCSANCSRVRECPGWPAPWASLPRVSLSEVKPERSEP